MIWLAALALLAAPAAAAPTPLSFVWPTSVEVEPGGSLLVVENGLHRLMRVSPMGRVTVVAALRKPYAVRRTRSGSIYVTDGHALRRIDGQRAPVKVAQAVDDIGPIALAPNGDVYFTTEKGLWRLPGGRGKPVRLAAKTPFSTPHGIAIERGGAVLVSDTGNHRILRVERSGVVTLFARLAVPGGMDVAADGTVYVTEGSAGRVVHLSATGKRLGLVGHHFDDPYSVRLAPGGVLYVVESLESGDVRRVAPDGTVTTVSRG